MFINGLDDNTSKLQKLLKFVDDTKVFRKVKMMVINNIYKTILANELKENSSKSSRLLIFFNVNAYTQDTETFV